MEYSIERVQEYNYSLFEDMIYYRETGKQREAVAAMPSEQIKKELANTDLYVYAVKVDQRYAGWISLIYLPKVGRWKGQGHVYVDELWVGPEYRCFGLAKALMRKADELKDSLHAQGIRLYVNVDNPAAQHLYQGCGYIEQGQAIFMEK